jgi:hypothetical protein
MPTFADRGRHVISVTNPYSHILGFLDWSRCFFFQVAPQLYSQGWVYPVPDPLLLRKSGSAGNRTRAWLYKNLWDKKYTKKGYLSKHSKSLSSSRYLDSAVWNNLSALISHPSDQHPRNTFKMKEMLSITLALDGVVWSASRSGHFIIGERTPTYCIGNRWLQATYVILLKFKHI